MTFLHTITKLIIKIKDGLGRPVFILFVKYLGVMVLIFHFLALGLHQLPDNPLKHQFKYDLHGYVDPFFSQAWTLFAPNPINTNMSLLVRFEYKGNDTQAHVTEWIDITEPLIKDRQENFWSPAQRISKFTQSCMSNINENHIILVQQIAKTDSIKEDSVKIKSFYNKMMSTTYGHRSLLQYSNHIANDYFLNKGVEAIDVKFQYRIFNARFPRFSKRKEDYYNLDNYEFSELTSDFIPIEN